MLPLRKSRTLCIAVMRRWLTVALLVLLPLQSFWAAAATYCAHEQGAVSQHFGKHKHCARCQNACEACAAACQKHASERHAY